MACAKLHIRHTTTSPFSPEAKGKDERFMGTVDQIINEMNLFKPKTLKALNDAIFSWQEEGNNNKPHSTNKGLSPAIGLFDDSLNLCFASPEELL